MKFIMMCVSIGSLLWVTFVLPHPIKSVAKANVEGVYQLVAFTPDLRRVVEGSKNITVCGKYFAEGVSKKEKALYFSIEKPSSFTFPKVGATFVTVNEKFTVPKVLIFGNKRDVISVVGVNAADYVDGLPCLTADGIGI